MIAQGYGRIVNLGSQAGFVALPGESVYCMTKAAISHLTKCLAVEWGPHGITVNAVAPTFIVTPGTAPALDDPALKADILERIAALHRVGDPMDVAGAVVFLASPAASLITGAHAADRRRLDGPLTACSGLRELRGAGGRAARRSGAARTAISTPARRRASASVASAGISIGDRDQRDAARPPRRARWALNRWTLRHRNATWASR